MWGNASLFLLVPENQFLQHISLETNNLLSVICLRKLPPTPAATSPSSSFCMFTVMLLSTATSVAINPLDTLQLSPRSAAFASKFMFPLSG